MAVSGDFGGARAADVAIVGSRLTAVALTGAVLDRLHLSDCVVADSEWSGVTADDGELTRVEFRSCRMSGLVVSRARLRDVRFVDCRLDGASLRMARGTRITFEGCDLRGVDCYELALDEARFERCDLRGADVSGAQLAGARLAGSTLDDVRGARHLAGTVIDSSQIVAVGLSLIAALDITIDDSTDSARGCRGSLTAVTIEWGAPDGVGRRCWRQSRWSAEVKLMAAAVDAITMVGSARRSPIWRMATRVAAVSTRSPRPPAMAQPRTGVPAERACMVPTPMARSRAARPRMAALAARSEVTGPSQRPPARPGESIRVPPNRHASGGQHAHHLAVIHGLESGTAAAGAPVRRRGAGSDSSPASSLVG